MGLVSVRRICTSILWRLFVYYLKFGGFKEIIYYWLFPGNAINVINVVNLLMAVWYKEHSVCKLRHEVGKYKLHLQSI